MATGYLVVRAFTLRGIRYDRGYEYHPETPEDAMQLEHLHLIERIRPPGEDKGGVQHGGNH